MTEPLFPDLEAELEPFLADRRSRTLPATLHDSGGLVLATGEARRGIPADPGGVFYPQSPPVVPDDQLARTSWIQIGDEKVPLEEIHHCWCGSSVHCDYREV